MFSSVYSVWIHADPGKEKNQEASRCLTVFGIFFNTGVLYPQLSQPMGSMTAIQHGRC